MLFIYEEITFTVGKDTFVSSGVDASKTVVFEDNEETGYFYAVSRENGMGVLDALHIYDVANVADKHIPSVLKMLWTEDESKVFLSINDYYHAAFDFRNRAGYCRSAFPGPKSPGTRVEERALTDQLIDRLIMDHILRRFFGKRTKKMGYKSVCLDCQKVFNLESDYIERAMQSEKCPECGQIAIRYPHRFRPPKKSDDKAWEVVRFLYENGFMYHHITNAERSGYEKYPETMKEAREFVDRIKNR